MRSVVVSVLALLLVFSSVSAQLYYQFEEGTSIPRGARVAATHGDSPILKRASELEMRRLKAMEILSRNRCFFNPITC